MRARCDIESRRNNDPVEFVHRYTDAADRELVALIASALAFGNVKALRAKIEDALARLGPDLARTAEDPAEVARRLRAGNIESTATITSPVSSWAPAASSAPRARSAERWRSSSSAPGDLREALSAWAAAIRREGGLDGANRGGATSSPTRPKAAPSSDSCSCSGG